MESTEVDNKERFKEINIKSHGRSEEIEKYRKQNLKRMTPSHKKAYGIIKAIAWKVFGYTVVKEKKLTPYILDIYLKEIKIGIEIDGGVHINNTDYDKTRDAYLSHRYGVKVYRFMNEDVSNLMFLKKAIWAICYDGLMDTIERINNKANSENIAIPPRLGMCQPCSGSNGTQKI